MGHKKFLMDNEIKNSWLTLQEKLETLLGNLVRSGSEIMYLDYPVHRNVGDLLIFLGSETWIRKNNIKVYSRWFIDNFIFPQISERILIICHGGGNFGDLYKHQLFREEIVKKYPNNRIIFLPQTIHYNNLFLLKRTATILNNHRDLHLFLRDQRSFDLARFWFPDSECYLAPDMATFLYPLQESLNFQLDVSSKGSTIFLLRKDLEQRADQDPISPSPSWEGDWEEMLGLYAWELRFWQMIGRLSRQKLPAQVFASVWHSSARRIAIRCALKFLEADHIVTSRLHGHILACLLGISNTLLDNSYGKNSAYFQCWHQDLNFTTLHGATL